MVELAHTILRKTSIITVWPFLSLIVEARYFIYVADKYAGMH